MFYTSHPRWLKGFILWGPAVTVRERKLLSLQYLSFRIEANPMASVNLEVCTVLPQVKDSPK